MKIWTTKYALSQGIIEYEDAKLCLDTDHTGNMIGVKDKGFSMYFHGEGEEWHKTKESAINKADEMRKKKIASLKKQIERLENMKF